jgi:hypothetical protein
MGLPTVDSEEPFKDYLDRRFVNKKPSNSAAYAI